MSGSDEAPGGEPNQRPPAQSYQPSFNRPPRPWARPQGQRQLRPPTVDPFARPQHYPTQHYHPYNRPSGRGRGSQQTRLSSPAPSTSSQGYSNQNLNVAGPSASYTPAQISQAVPHAEPNDETGEQQIPVVVTHPELRPPAEPFNVNLDEGYKVKQIKGFPFSPYIQPGDQPISTVVTDRQDYQEEPLMSEIPQGMKHLPRKPTHSQVEIPGKIYGLMPRALRDQVDQQLIKAHELFLKIMNDKVMLNKLWVEHGKLIMDNYHDYHQFIHQQRLVLRHAFNYDVGLEIKRFRNRIKTQHQQPYQVHTDLIFEIRQHAENMISDLEWYISASRIVMENMNYVLRLAGLPTASKFSEDPNPNNLPE